jgi:biopolymer transport protein ExbD
MAGSSSEDDAVSLNVTPLIDIIFCLCIFFMCSFHFKQVQGSIDSWLPQNVGNDHAAAAKPVPDEIRVFLRQKGAATEIAFGARPCPTLDDLEAILKQEWDDLGTRGKQNETSVIIDGEPGVPWRDVVGVIDRMKKLQIQKIEFAQPMPAGPNRG